MGRRGTFWASAAVLALALWSSGAPSALYPLYAEKWDLSPVVITSVFATYQIALIVVLQGFGNLSDIFGRRLVMLGGVGLIAVSALVFAFAPHVAFLYAGRALQGAGAGLAMGAATASLIENNTSGNPRFASSMATVATSTGLTLALLLSGLLAYVLPLPLVWSYLLLLALSLVSITALFFALDDKPVIRQRWRPQRPRVARDMRLGFSIATLSVALAYCVGAVMLSLGANMITQFTHTDNVAIVGALLACSSAAIGITALLLARVPALQQIRAGAALTILSLALMVAASRLGSMGMFLGWCVIGGIAYALAFTGGLGLLNSVAPAQHRGATLSLMYLIVYASQAVTAVGVGALATTGTLATAVGAVAVIILPLCVVLFVMLGLLKRSTAPDERRIVEEVSH